MVVRLLKESVKNAGNPFGDEAIEKITGSIRHPNNEIKLFKNEKNHNILVTVDLLTTGVDVPEINNLVFLRLVQSKILYEQIIGRLNKNTPEIPHYIFNHYDTFSITDDRNTGLMTQPIT
ncbi:helicase-related protein, partial [Lactobacillus taiwanensis]|uniref:helicase-related protein n=1 Tax=Lactobacillus taiwanensis TaxID=508451 RepID=UPI0021C49869